MTQKLHPDHQELIVCHKRVSIYSIDLKTNPLVTPGGHEQGHHIIGIIPEVDRHVIIIETGDIADLPEDMLEADQDHHMSTENTEIEVDHHIVLTGKENTVSLLGVIGEANHHIMMSTGDQEDGVDHLIEISMEAQESIRPHLLDIRHLIQKKMKLNTR